MKTVAITGIGGFLGGASARFALRQGWRVVGTGIDPIHSELKDKVDFWTSDPVSTKTVSKLFAKADGVDVFIHAAGNGKVGSSWDNPHGDFVNNVASTADVLEVLRTESPDTVLVLPSSAAVYGNTEDMPTRENSSLNPISPYGVHKMMAEQMCTGAAHLLGLKCVVMRFFSLYGPGLKKQILWDIFNKLTGCPETLSLSGIPEASRDFLYVDDCVNLMFTAATKSTTFPITLNGGSGQATSIEQIAQHMIDNMSPSTKLSFDHEVRAGDPLHMLADITVAESLGFKPQVSLPDGIKNYIAWAQQQT